MRKSLFALPVLGSVASAFAAEGEYTATSAAQTVATNLTQLAGDVTNTIGPAAIGICIAVAMVVVGRSFIKKFFKV